jgi:endonuclease YncB( thermonuclease family)
MRRKSGKPFRLVKDGAIFVALLILGTLIAARLDGMNQQRFSGQFIAVDGDTIAYDRERFRLIGIDAPELKQTCVRQGGEWPCGAQAKEQLKTLLQAGVVECFGSENDKYRRLLVRCSAGGRDIAADMVAAGYAVTTEYFLFSREQAAAKDQRSGIWSGTFEQPRDWRREHKAADMDVPLTGMVSLVRQILGW